MQYRVWFNDGSAQIINADNTEEAVEAACQQANRQLGSVLTAEFLDTSELSGPADPPDGEPEE